ncbi:dihydroorotase family protein [Paenibacillus sp. S150]|uniref:dihydroorotase n=1 Tax=Paenibacillus sp. S150 TaxID=2749826 RepID=UPI001C563368|nr:amidohydrolase family protein [Paenibacillus sp. S150]MBW4079808.1 amidohydrolase family protein [Paenibacillus sp. S150]
MDTIIYGGEAVIPYIGVKKVDIGIKNGRISALGEGLSAPGAKRIDASGKMIFPGAIDGHSHYGVYGGLAQDYRATSRSSAVGGVTTVINFMRSGRSYLEQLPEEVAIAEQESVIDFCFHLGVMTSQQVQEMRAYVEELGALSFKLYLGYKGMEKTRYGTDRSLDDELLLDIYEQMNAISPDLILCIHCENVEMGRNFYSKYVNDPERNQLVYFDKFNPDIVETESVIRVSYLAKQYQAKISIVHCSAGTSVQALREMPWFTPELIHVETCPHYLLETVDNAKGLGAIVKPPLRYRHDNEALWQGIKDGIVTFTGTDHVSITWADKFKKGGGIDDVQLGFGGAEFMFPQMLSEGHHKRGLSLQKIAEITSANTAKTYGLFPQKGMIDIGSDADLVIVDLEKTATITPETIAINSDYSIYEGREVKGWPVMTLRRGEIIAENGQAVEPAGGGKYLKRKAKGAV